MWSLASRLPQDGVRPQSAGRNSTTISMCFSFRSNCLCAVTGGRGSYKSLRNRYVRLYMNAVESSILFLLDFGTICGVAQSEWNSQTWSLIDHRSVQGFANRGIPRIPARVFCGTDLCGRSIQITVIPERARRNDQAEHPNA